MKKILCALVLVLGVVILNSCGPTTEQATAYNDAIIDEQVAVMDKINAVYDAFKGQDPASMDKAYTDAVNQVKTGTDVVSKMEKFGGSTEFRDGAIELFKVYQSVLDNEYKEMITIYKLPDEEYTPEQETKWNTLSDQALGKMDTALEKLKKIQADFAKKYKFEIETTS
jgi:hypothetical protein